MIVWVAAVAVPVGPTTQKHDNEENAHCCAAPDEDDAVVGVDFGGDGDAAEAACGDASRRVLPCSSVARFSLPPKRTTVALRVVLLSPFTCWKDRTVLVQPNLLVYCNA